MSRFESIVVGRLEAWADALAAALPNIAAALVVVTVFAIAGRPVSKLAKRALRGSDSELIARLAAVACRYALLAIGIFFALGIVGLDRTVTSLLAGAGVLGIALGFAFQDIAANFVAGVLMAVRQPFAIGDVVTSNGFTGVVKNLNLRSTTLETFSGQTVLLPNREVFTNALTNYNGTGVRRVELDVGISYADDIQAAVDAARSAIADLDFLAQGRDVEVLAHAFGGSSIDLKVRYWIDQPGETPYPAAAHRGIVAIKTAFDSAGIDIPFPIRTLKLDEGVADIAR